MRLQQLLEIIQTERIIKKTDSLFDREKTTKKRFEIMSRVYGNGGLYGRVYSAGNPHMIVKTNYIPSKPTDDPYLNYITYISDNNRASKNPFFPRIYKIQYLEDNTGKVKYRIEMEKLQELNTTDYQIVIALLKGLFSPENYAGEDIDIDTPSLLAAQVDRVIRGRIKSKSESLNAAGALIREVKGKYGGGVDMHSGNLMIRLSPIPQLVITDPLA